MAYVTRAVTSTSMSDKCPPVLGRPQMEEIFIFEQLFPLPITQMPSFSRNSLKIAAALQPMYNNHSTLGLLAKVLINKSIDQQKSNYPFLADLQDLPRLPSHMSRISIRCPALPSSTFPNLADPKAPAVTPASRQRSTANKPDPNQPCRSMQVHLPFTMIIL